MFKSAFAFIHFHFLLVNGFPLHCWSYVFCAYFSGWAVFFCFPPLSVVLIEPLKHGANTAAGHGNARIRRAIIQSDRVTIRSNCVAARKDDVVDISVPLVRFFRGKNPLVAAFEANLWCLQIEQSQAEPVNGAGCVLTHSVVDHQPAVFRADRRRRRTSSEEYVGCSLISEPGTHFCHVASGIPAVWLQ